MNGLVLLVNAALVNCVNLITHELYVAIVRWFYIPTWFYCLEYIYAYIMESQITLGSSHPSTSVTRPLNGNLPTAICEWFAYCICVYLYACMVCVYALIGLYACMYMCMLMCLILICVCLSCCCPHNLHLSPNSHWLMFLFVDCATVSKVYLILFITGIWRSSQFDPIPG